MQKGDIEGLMDALGYREIRSREILEAEKLVNKIRKEANLTVEESRLLTVKMTHSNYEFANLPKPIMKKLREACKRLNITYKGVSVE